MKTKTTLATLLIALAAVVVPALAPGDAGSTVQADLVKLSADVKTAHDALVPDLAAVTTAAQGGDKNGVRAAVVKLRSDGSTLLPAVQADRKQLVSDVKSARAAGTTGLRLEVRAAVKGNRVASRELRQARREARKAVRAFRRANQRANP
jgi:hypothetical protein